jgi:hypothetical protein
MFFEGDRNSVSVGVCGTNVPLVADVVVVVELAGAGLEVLVDPADDDGGVVVLRAAEVVVVDGDEPPEHDANTADTAASTRTGNARRKGGFSHIRRA